MGEVYSCASGGVIAGGRSLSAASGIAITDTVYQRVYQRVGTSKSLPVSGTYTGTASLIQARACPVGTATNALGSTYPWATLVMMPSGGAFAGSLAVPQGDGWIVQVRDGVDHAIAAAGTHSFGVGVFVALIGQSNMENSFSSIYGWPLGSPSAYLHHSGAFSRLGNINDSFAPGTLSPAYSGSGYTSEAGAQFGNAIVLMANGLVASLGIPVVLLTYAASGSSITNWQPGQTYLNNLLTDADTVGGDFETAIWLQGESDAATGMGAATYQAYLQALFDTCKSHTGRDSALFHFGVVNVGPATDAWALAAERMGPIRKAQMDFVAANASNGAFLAGSAIDGNLAGASTVHIDTQSLFRQGRRYAEALKRRLSGATYGIEGPKITGVARAGAVVTVSIQQRGGTALIDGAGGSGSALLGFRVFDGGAPCTISSTAISGNTVVLTLAATPAGAVTLDYAMANAPFGTTTAAASVVYDNQAIPGATDPYSTDAFGLPLQPCPTITVT